MKLELFLKVAKDAALQAGPFLKGNFHEKKVASFKSDFDVGLPEDKHAEKIILSVIRQAFPEHKILSEEVGQIGEDSEYCWYIDPLDGTNNYFAGIAYFSTSIALAFRNEPLIGVVYNPITGQLFHAIKGQGAFLNNSPITHSNSEYHKRAVAAYVRGHLTHTGQADKTAALILSEMQQIFRRVLIMWAPALDWCLVASGGIDAIVSFSSEMEDQLAGSLIASEAGCLVTNFRGDAYSLEDRFLIGAATPALSAHLVDRFKEQTAL